MQPLDDHKTGKWEEKVNEENLKIQIRQKGSELNKDVTCIMTDMYFDAASGISLKNLIRSIHNPKVRTEWDKDIEIFTQEFLADTPK